MACVSPDEEVIVSKPVEEPQCPATACEQDHDEVDFAGFPRPKRKTLLESTMYPPFSAQDLKVFLDVGEDPDEVEKHGDGFGPIHYVVTKAHSNKPDLLVGLVIQGNADVDLTTTARSEITALHLAAKEGDVLSLKTLISLGADVNKHDEFGNTPLDYAVLPLNHPPAETDVAMVSLDLGETTSVRRSAAHEADLLEPVELTWSSVDYLRSTPIEYPVEDSDIVKYLKMVGGTHGRHRFQQRGRLSSTSSQESETQSFEYSRQASNSHVNIAKINTEFFHQVEYQTSQMLKYSDVVPKSEEAVEFVKLLKQQEEYKRKCGSRILCLDGGGIRGLLQLTILQEIERRTGKRITELFDWIVGTSTGGIIVLALVYGKTGLSEANEKTVSDVRNMFWRKKDEIFKKRADGLLGKGNTSDFEAVLKEWMGERVTLVERTRRRPNVLIPAVLKEDTDLKLHFFNNCFNDDYSKELVWKVARYTSAAPFYFSEFDNYIDGGMLANNPAADALTKIQDHYRQKSQKLPISLLVSVGSGKNPPVQLGAINVHKDFLNPKAWIDFFEVMESALLSKSTHENCHSRCQEQGIKYFRFNLDLDEKVDSDQKDPAILLNMLYKTRSYLHDENRKLDELTTLLDQSELTSA